MAVGAYGSMVDRYQSQQEAEEKARLEAERRAGLINGVPVAASGATQFSKIDEWLTKNPEAKYFRIDNNGSSVPSPRSYAVSGNPVEGMGGAYQQGDNPARPQYWTDNSAALVSTLEDTQTRDIFRYTNISAAPVRQGKRGETPTFGRQYTGGEFFTSNNIQYGADDGIIMSREEYGALKESLRSAGAGGFFQYEKYAKSPEPDNTGAKTAAALAAKADNGRGVEAIVQGGDQLGGAQTEEPGTDVTTAETLNKRTLLG